MLYLHCSGIFQWVKPVKWGSLKKLKVHVYPQIYRFFISERHESGIFQYKNDEPVIHAHLSIVAGLVVRHGDLSHEMTLSHEGRRPDCDNVNRV